MKDDTSSSQQSIDAAEYIHKLETWCKELPKVELHAHLNGSISMQYLQELAQRLASANIKSSKKVEQMDEITTQLRILRQSSAKERSLSDCFKIFDIIHAVTADLPTLAEITKEVIRRFAVDNVKYLELRTTPRDDGSNMTKESYVNTVLTAIEETMSSNDLDIDVRLILSINRKESVKEAFRTVNLAIEHKQMNSTVVGIDISGNPHLGDIRNYESVFQTARNAGLATTIHMAEIYNPEETKYVLSLKPNRIGHACFLNSELREAMMNAKIPLELCLTSNVCTASVESYNDHHFEHFYAKEYPVCLCTDDMGVFDTTLSKEYVEASRAFALSSTELFNLSRNAIHYSFADNETKNRLLQQFESQQQHLTELATALALV